MYGQLSGVICISNKWEPSLSNFEGTLRHWCKLPWSKSLVTVNPLSKLNVFLEGKIFWNSSISNSVKFSDSAPFPPPSPPESTLSVGPETICDVFDSSYYIL